MLPDSNYPGGITLDGTGLQFSSEASVVKGAIALLKQRNPNTKVGGGWCRLGNAKGDEAQRVRTPGG